MFPQDDALYREMFDRVHTRVREVVTPLGVGNDTGVDQWGTGTLLAVGNSHFVVTAAHVLEQTKPLKRPLYGFAHSHRGENGMYLSPVQFAGRTLRFDDPLDVAVMRLDPQSVRGLSSRSFLRLNEIALGPRCPGWGWVSGFPVEMVRNADASAVYNLFNAGAVLTTQEPDGVCGFDERFHFVLDTRQLERFEWPFDGVRLPDRFGGVSGCSVWQTWWPPEDKPPTWRTQRVKVVGVQTGTYKKGGFFKATNWAAVLILISASSPDLLPLIQMHFPGWNIEGQARQLAGRAT